MARAGRVRGGSFPRPPRRPLWPILVFLAFLASLPVLNTFASRPQLLVAPVIEPPVAPRPRIDIHIPEVPVLFPSGTPKAVIEKERNYHRGVALRAASELQQAFDSRPRYLSDCPDGPELSVINPDGSRTPLDR